MQQFLKFSLLIIYLSPAHNSDENMAIRFFWIEDIR